MSDRASSDRALDGALPDHPRDAGDFTRWPGLLSLTLGVLLGPIAAAVNQLAIYAANTWACGDGYRASLHIIPVLCLAVSVGTGLSSRRNWRLTGDGVEEEHGDVVTRSRFLAIMGMWTSAFSSLVIVAQWLAIFVFNSCMRA